MSAIKSKIPKIAKSAGKKHEEFQYLNLVKNALKNGHKTTDRTGTGTLSLFGGSMRFNLRKNSFPLLTTKRTAYKSILAELLFFIRGQTDNKILNDQNVHIWDGNSTKEYFEKIGIDRRPGDLGPVYGFQWRHFGAEYKGCDADYTGKGYDQLQAVIDNLRSGASSRRLVVSAWNPTQMPEMALPPCHCLFQFQRQGKFLNCSLYQRSADLGLGVPFNIASYALLTIAVARLTGLEPGEFVHFLGDCHIYNNHIEAMKEQLPREPYPFPKLKLKEKKYEKLEDFEMEDFLLEDYECHPRIKMAMKKELETAKGFDVKRYVGKWYEIARLPNWFEASCSFGEGGPTAEYKLGDGIIEVKNSSKKIDSRERSSIEGAAIPVAKGDNTKLFVVFPKLVSRLLYYPVRFCPFRIKGNYWVLKVKESESRREPDYKIAYVGSPDRSMLWLLARSQKVSEKEYELFLEYADQYGFDKSKILRVRD